jgi:RHS repeat-associated protein
MSMASGGVSEKAAGGVYSNPQAVSVSQVGATSFSYPIAVPPGRNNLQPNVALQYSSYNENSWVGVGWDLDLGSIKRSTKNGLIYGGTDFVVNGSELVANTTWGTNYYCEKIEGGFTKYYFNTSSNSWLVTAKDGTTYRYGYSTSSRMASGTNTYSWHLDRVEDTNGNYMTISYTTDNNQIYPNIISYTGKTGGLSPNKTIEFGLETRTDNIYSYKTKYLVTTTKRLKTITVKVDGATAYKYILNYENSGPNGRSRLIQIKQVDRNNDNINLPPTNFTWSNGGNGTFGSPSSITLNGPAGGSCVFGDINGDGKQDFIKAYSTGTNPTVTVYPYLANSSGGFTAQTSKTLAQCPTNYMSVSLGDVNGDNKADILSNGLNGQVHVYLSNGDGTFSSKYTTAGSNSASSAFLAELNGDGKADLVRSDGNYAYTALSNGNGYFGTQQTFTIPIGSSGVTMKRIDTKLCDVNGDGRADLYVYKHFEIFNFPNYYPLTVIGIFPGNGDGTFSSTAFYMNSWEYKVEGCAITDINGDGLSDLVYLNQNNNLIVCLSNGTGMTQVSSNLTMNTINISFADINDDGMADLISPDYFYKSNGDGTFASPISSGGLTAPLGFADIDGDGRSDIIYPGTNSIGYSQANGADAADKIVSIVNPLGGQTDITYGNSSGLTYNRIPYIVHPVTAVDVDDNINLTPAETTYAYSDGYYKYADRDFRGFGTVIQTNPDGSTVKTTYFQLDDYIKGKPSVVDMKNPSGTFLKRLTYTWGADTLSGTTAKFVKLIQKTTDIYGTTNVYTTDTYTYDNTHGGVLTTVNSGTGSNTGTTDNVTTTNTYVNANTSGWIWRKASESISGSITGQARQATYIYDTKGNLLTKTSVNNAGASPVEEYTYDSYGNIEYYYAPKYQASKSAFTKYTYDTTTRTQAIRIDYPTTGSVTHWETMDYHPQYGKVVQETDENNQSTYFEYDNYGRLNLMDYPDEGQTVYTYYDTADPVYVKTSVRETDSGYIDSYQYVDGLGRAVMNVTKGTGTNYVVSRQFFDNMGRDYYYAGPYFSNTSAYSHTPPATYPTSSKTYDYMGRVIGIFTPVYNGAQNQFNTTAVSYNGFITTITDAKGNLRTEVTDYLGRIIQVQEDTGGGTTNYTYNAAGDLKAVTDDAINVTTINYNTLGQKVNMTDPDMGTWYYSYDLNGNLYQQTDALSQTITFTYDALNRVTFKDYSTLDPDVTYSYDNLTGGTNGRGRLYYVTNGNDTTTNNNYDEMGRPLSVTKTISGDQARPTSYIYDYSGKTIRTTYPDGYYVDDAYYAGTNLLNTVTGSDGVSYASIGSYSPSGKMVSLVHGNNTSDTYTYDARTELLSQVQSKIGASTVIQQKSYGYTNIGEISSINDQHNGVSYAYSYDKLSRLTNETANGTTTGGYAYNAIGNITSKTVGGNTFTYSYSATHKHAVSGITYNGTTYSYSYDANGNMTYGADFTNLASIQARTITYNADNMPTEISHSSNITTQLTYGGTGERVKKRVYSGGNVTDTYYIGDHFEVKGGETIKYIFAGNLRVALVKGTTKSFYHKDHLGSSTVMTSGSGAELESTEYMPFGSQRSHSGTNTSDYRFTDQELDAENGLYNYGARLYDPFIGRFISPDTIVQEPFNPQSLNRYTYCLNNPLIYTDPSGHNWITDAFKSILKFLGGEAEEEKEQKDPNDRKEIITVGPFPDNQTFTYVNGHLTTGVSIGLANNPVGNSGGGGDGSNPKLNNLKLTDQQKTFFKDIAPIIKEGTSGTGVLPSVAIAQAALESGWGKKAHITLYGIKGAGNAVETKEFINGKWEKVVDSFKTSDSIKQSVGQYVELLTTNNRYANALKTSDPYIQIQEIKNSGYATDPNYVNNVNSIIRKYDLPFYDPKN